MTAPARFPARPGRTVPIPDAVDPRSADALRARGVEALYTHQAEARRQGGTAVVVTPTASGKTLCYNLPVLQYLLTEPAARALYLFPTKALAQDHLRGAGGAGAGACRSSGSTPHDGGDAPGRPARPARANVVLTNPDMLHAGILPAT